MATQTPARTSVTQPRLGPVGWARWAWRSLTSMRTALFLLLLLSIAAVPGSIFPQRSIDAAKVADFIASNPTTGPWLDRLGFFEVYSSVWFSAIYLLLVISLVGCIVPRSRMHWHTLRAKPPRAPRNLSRLDQHVELSYAGDVDSARAAATEALRHKRFRVVSHDDESVSAESGYLRETGNLVFHTGLCVVIIGVAVGHLFGWRGDVILTEGDTFSSTLSSYDSFLPGAMTDPEKLPPFTIDLRSMNATFEDQVGGAQFGAPRSFTADVTTTEQPGGPSTQSEISPNHPVTLDGADVFLLGNGYAPVVTVRDASGAVLYQQATPFLAQDNVYTSVGAIKVGAARPTALAFSGFFLPTAEPTYANGPTSLFPDDRNPELALSVWEGDLFPANRPQSVYTLDTTNLSQLTKADGTPLLIRLQPGQTFELPDGRGSISFDKVDRFAGLSARVDPGKELTLVAAIATILGLMASLLVRRRRIFVRVRPTDDPSRTLVTIGGLARTSDPGLGAVLAGLRTELSKGP
ncbi:MAG TPA: cytochrome c biogenesis protein ResB [Lapillicoccus sp.]|jgi:cytochrome c biogenesis protein|uniref:cytochrome c biogenesis protein ResB n=1 Tax=Lapillicoccus sp. TaxID=1909287 RepID=UPI002F936B6C